MPTVSVVIASYNHALYLPECLDSILSQTYQDFEIVVIDDGSSDGSHELLMDYQRRYPDKVRYSWHPNHANRGVTATCNIAIGKAQGEYLAWLGSDDVWLPGKLARQVDFMGSHPGFGMVYGPAIVIDEDGNCYPGSMGRELAQDALPQLLVSNDICASSVLIRRACLDEVGLFNEKLVYSDWELWIRIAAQYPVGFIPEPLVRYRIHGRNMSIADLPTIKFDRNVAVIESAFDQRPGMGSSLKGKAMASAHLGLALDYFAAGRPEMARQQMDQAARLLRTPLPCPPDELIELVVAYAMYWLPTFQGKAADRLQFVHLVFSSIAPALERKAMSKMYMTDVFKDYRQGELASIRGRLWRAIWLDLTWLRNKGVLAMLIKSLLGRGVAGRLRWLARPSESTQGQIASLP